MDDQDAIRCSGKDAIEAFPAAVADYRRGKTAAIGRLIGETIKEPAVAPSRMTFGPS